MALFVDVHFIFGPECILDPFSFLAKVGDSVVTKRVYRGCVVSFSRKTFVDLIELDMVDFDVILGIGCIHAMSF